MIINKSHLELVAGVALAIGTYRDSESISVRVIRVAIDLLTDDVFNGRLKTTTNREFLEMEYVNRAMKLLQEAR